MFKPTPDAQEVVYNHNNHDHDRRLDDYDIESKPVNPTSATATDEAAAAAEADELPSSSMLPGFFSMKNIVACGVFVAVGVAGIVGAASVSAHSTQMKKNHAAAVSVSAASGGGGPSKIDPDFSWLEGIYSCVSESSISRANNQVFHVGESEKNNGCDNEVTLEIERASDDSTLAFIATVHAEIFDLPDYSASSDDKGTVNIIFAGVGSYNDDEEIILYGDFNTFNFLPECQNYNDLFYRTASDVATLKLSKMSQDGTIAALFYDNEYCREIHAETIRSYVMKKGDE